MRKLAPASAPRRRCPWAAKCGCPWPARCLSSRSWRKRRRPERTWIVCRSSRAGSTAPGTRASGFSTWRGPGSESGVTTAACLPWAAAWISPPAATPMQSARRTSPPSGWTSPSRPRSRPSTTPGCWKSRRRAMPTSMRWRLAWNGRTTARQPFRSAPTPRPSGMRPYAPPARQRGLGYRSSAKGMTRSASSSVMPLRSRQAAS